MMRSDEKGILSLLLDDCRTNRVVRCVHMICPARLIWYEISIYLQ